MFAYSGKYPMFAADTREKKRGGEGKNEEKKRKGKRDERREL